MKYSLLPLVLILVLPGCRNSPRRSAADYAAQRRQAAPSPVAEGIERFFAHPEEVLVRIHGRALTRGDFLESVFRQFGEMTLLSEVIKEEIFLQEAERRELKVSKKEIESEVEELLDGMSRDLGRGDSAAGRIKLADLYEKQGLTLNDVREELRKKMVSQVLVKRVTVAMRDPAKLDLRSLYEKNRRFYTRHIAYSFPSFQDQPTAEQAVSKKSALEKASQAREKIVSKKVEFAAVARAESEDRVTQPVGGDLGPITAATPMAESLKKAIFSLKPGEVSQPVENPRGGYHLFQVTRIEPAGSYDEVKDELRKNYMERDPDVEEIRQAFYRLRAGVRIEWPSEE
ncbi:MAG: peptidylprolyl isomerase [Planctomycetota bacterium]|nr:peptidylprolyl isomerase [Planctomycetota bacterium]